MERNVYLELIPPAQAYELWLKAIKEQGISLGEEEISLDNALGRTVARPVAAKRSSPAFHGAAMDGIAVKAEQTYTASPRNPLRLAINKDAFWINTGRPMPEGTNAVIMVEHLNTEEDGKIAVIEKAAFPWQNVRKIGEDMIATEIILSPGTIIGPYEIGALAASGVLSLPVFKKPVVAIIPSGSEIAPLDEITEEELNSGVKLPEFNSSVFAAMIKGAGGTPHIMTIVPDNPELIATALKNADADLLILNAGASAGSHDFSAQVIKEIGTLIAHGIALMPGKPASLGLIGRTPILGAPGYPVSAIMAVEEFALPLLAWLQKRPPAQSTQIDVYPCNPVASRPGLEERVRVKLGKVKDKFFAVPLPRGAGIVSSLSRADAIISIPPESEGLNKNEAVKAKLIRPISEIEGALLAIGSHDSALDLIDSFLRREYPEFRLTSAHVGSLGGLLALKQGQCHLAGSHLLDPETGIYNQKAIQEQLPDESVALFRLVDREQGLMVMPGNPKHIKGFTDLAREDVRFINRQAGSGTRVLLDYNLEQSGIRSGDINGYRDEEYTHTGVAAAVLSGRADTGLGAKAAANALGLDFIPVGMEQYDLVIPKKYLSDPRIESLLAVIKTEAFKNAILKMGGYGVEKTGELVWEST